jgi:N,N-dimethylformamidase
MTVLLGYADQVSVAPGDRIDFKVSCEGAAEYEARIVRLHSCDAGPAAPPFHEEEIRTEVDGRYPGHRRILNAGSYGLIDDFPIDAWGSGLTLQVFVYATAPGGRPQALLGNWCEQQIEGFELGLDATGAPMLLIGSNGQREVIRTGIPLLDRRWYRITATLDGSDGRVQLAQCPMHDRPAHPASSARIEATAKARPAGGNKLLTLAARYNAGSPKPVMTSHFDGKLDRPRVAVSALAPHDWDALGAHRPATSLCTTLAGAWDFSAGIRDTSFPDVSGNERHGRVINLPKRAVTGLDWTGEFTDWRLAPEHYSAVHFHQDDLYDAGWDTDFSLTISKRFSSGVYAARLRTGDAEFHVPFFVRALKDSPSSSVVFLASTATYMAYANHRSRLLGDLTELVQGRLTVIDDIDLLQLSHPGMGRSLYDVHDDGSGVSYSSRLRPVTNFRPRGRIWNFAADLLIIDWLERSGFGYDVITDEDLHWEGTEALKPYRVIVSSTHPEYYSLQMLNALENFIGNGGRLMYLGGNGFYWRIAYHSSLPGVIEVRRGGDGVRAWESEPGECHHSFDGTLGGLWRRLGRPPNQLVGVGFRAEGFDASSHYRRTSMSRDPRAAFIFEGVTSEIIGDYGVLRNGAAGIELDASDFQLGTPSHALVVASSENHSNIFQLVGEEVLVPNSATDGTLSPRIRADLVFFEVSGGGAVFSTGSIAWAGSLGHAGYDNDIARITTNVLRRFADPAPFEVPTPRTGTTDS